MPPQITCPRCGNTINLENRREVDYDKIFCALNKSPKTFSQLLEITDLPRKTLCIRLKNLCTSGAIVKDGGYHLSASVAPDCFKNSIQRKRNGNGKMNGTLLRVGKNVQWMPVALIVCLLLVTFGSAALLSPPSTPAAPSPPKAYFAVVPSNSFTVGQALTFDAAPSKDLDGFIANYMWDFGDGEIGAGQVLTHTYTQEGPYVVILHVTDNKGYTAESRPKLIYVQSASVPSTYIPPTPPKVIKFTIAPDKKAGWENAWFVNRALTFDGSEFNAASYAWNFGDGTSATGPIATHAYQEAGTYTVTLTVADSDGDTQVTTQEVKIWDIPTTTIYTSTTQIGDTLTVNIMISDVADLYSWAAGMTFNPMVLQCIPASTPDNIVPQNATSAFAEGEFLKRGGATMWIPGSLDNNAGIIVAHCSTLLFPATPVSGNGILATVTFKVIGEGTPSIHLTNVVLCGMDLMDIPVYVAA